MSQIHIGTNEAMTVLRGMFPNAEASNLGFCLFSAYEWNGKCVTIEDVESGKDSVVAFLVVSARSLVLRYGTVRPETPEDFEFLKKLRESSHKAVAAIGLPQVAMAEPTVEKVEVEVVAPKAEYTTVHISETPYQEKITIPPNAKPHSISVTDMSSGTPRKLRLNVDYTFSIWNMSETGGVEWFSCAVFIHGDELQYNFLITPVHFGYLIEAHTEGDDTDCAYHFDLHFSVE